MVSGGLSQDNGALPSLWPEEGGQEPALPRCLLFPSQNSNLLAMSPLPTLKGWRLRFLKGYLERKADRTLLGSREPFLLMAS